MISRTILSWLSCGLFVLWLMVLLTPVLMPGAAFEAGLGQYVILSAFALVHGSRLYGWRAMLGFAVVLIVVANMFENLSINTGFPFGWFTHQPILGRKIFDVPIIVSFGYLSIGYISMAIARLVLDRSGRERGWQGLVSVAIVSAFVAAGWNASVDPLGAIVQKSYLYRDAGGYFGVPISNTFGWLLAMFVAVGMASMALRPAANEGQVSDSMLQGALPPLALFIQAPLLLGSWLAAPGGVVLDSAGHPWPLAALFETIALVSVVTCGAFGMIGLLRVWEQARLPN